MDKVDADQRIEDLIKSKGIVAQRVTKAHIDNLVASLTFYVTQVEDTTTTVAVATLPNGFTVATATAACADPISFDPEIGRQRACERAEAAARDKLWELEGWRLACHLNGYPLPTEPPTRPLASVTPIRPQSK